MLRALQVLPGAAATTDRDGKMSADVGVASGGASIGGDGAPELRPGAGASHVRSDVPARGRGARHRQTAREAARRTMSSTLEAAAAGWPTASVPRIRPRSSSRVDGSAPRGR